MTDLPPIDVIVISHNHYDHLDTHTVTTLEQAHAPHFFAPLGNDYYFEGLGIPKERTHTLDWWEARDVTLGLPGGLGETTTIVEAKFAVTCTPSQHFTARGLTDRFKTLWASWAIEDQGAHPAGKEGVKCWFAGDTGYRFVPSNEVDADPVELAKFPVCPEFKRIGDRFGGFDLALIPIGCVGFFAGGFCCKL